MQQNPPDPERPLEAKEFQPLTASNRLVSYQQDEQAQSAPVSRIGALLERYVAEGLLTRSVQELYASRYQKAYDMLSQLLQNEQVHVQNISDEQREIRTLDEQISAEERRESQLASQIFKLRQELEEQEVSIFREEDGSTKYSNEHTLLAEERMVLQQEIDFIKRERAEQLRPEIALLEQQAKELRDAIFSAQVVQKQKTQEIVTAKQGIEAADLALKITRDELAKAQGDLARAEALPEKYKRQISLIKQSQATAQADADRREAKLFNLQTEAEKTTQMITALESQALQARDQTAVTRGEQIVQLQGDFDYCTKELKSQKFELRDLNEIQQALTKKANSAKMSKFLIAQEVEQLQRDVNAAEKKEQHKAAALERANEAEVPLLAKQAVLQQELSVEEQKLQACEAQIVESRKAAQDAVVEFASRLNADDIYEEQILEANQNGKAKEELVFDSIAEIRDLQIQAIAAQSQRSAAGNRLARNTAYLKSTLAQLGIKDAEENRLTLELSAIQGKISTYSKLYEKLKTQKNRLARLAQESKLAIEEVRENIQVLKSEISVLSKESAEKQTALTASALSAKDAQRQLETLRESLANQKRLLREQHSDVARQISEIDALGSAISKHELSISQLMSAYFAAVEQRNRAGVQVIARTDELCQIYERLRTQEAVEKEAEGFMRARDEDKATLRIVISELERERELLERKCTSELPDVLSERQRIKDNLDTLRAENQQILDDIRGYAAITEDGGAVRSVLDLQSLYQENELLNGGFEKAVQAISVMSTDNARSQNLRPLNISHGPDQDEGERVLEGSAKKGELLEKPPQKLKQQIYATWNMVGNIDAVMPEVLTEKQKNIEKRTQSAREVLLEKYVLDEELTKLVDDLEKAIAQNKANVPADALAQCNAARARLEKVRRQLMAAISSLSLEEATSERLAGLKEELHSELVFEAENLKKGLPPTDEIEHEWLVQQQNQIEYAKSRELREEALAAQIPGLYPSKAKPRFDSYMNAETGLPRPYGSNAPVAPPEPSANVSRFYRKPAPQEIEI